jgi:hypothetical protein
MRALLVALLLGLVMTMREATPTFAVPCLITSDTYLACVGGKFDTLETALGTVQGDGVRTSLLARSATARSLMLGTSTQPGSPPIRAAGLLRGIGHEACGLRQSGQIGDAAFGTIQSSVGDLLDSFIPSPPPITPCVPPNPI